MFKSIRVRNFKSFEDSGEIRLAPLTLILGINSGGKSSLLQPLLALGQSVAQANMSFGRDFPLTANGPYVQLGDYREFVRGHDIRRKSQWDFTIMAEDLDAYRPASRHREPSPGGEPTDVHYRIQVAATNKGEDLVVGSVRIELPDRKASFTRGTNVTVLRLRGRAMSQARHERRPSRLNDLGLGIPYWQEDDRFEGSDMAAAKELTLLASRVLMQHFSRLRHAPPYREVPQRVYIASPAAPSEDLASQTRRLLRRPMPASFVKHWLAEFGVANDLDTNRLVEGLLILRLTDAATMVRSNLADFGFGTSQLLPLLIELAEVTGSPTVGRTVSHVIQQPEVHLHPAAQSLLADLFVDVVGNGRQLFVETHSEHLIYRVQRLIAEGRIDNSDVAIHYVDKGKAGSRVTSIDLGDNGTFARQAGLPAGFLDTGIKESLEFQRALSLGDTR